MTPHDPKRRNVAIVGFQHERYEAPFDDPEWECWGMNYLHTSMKTTDYAWDRWFQLHKRQWLQLHEPDHFGLHHLWMMDQRIPIYVADEWPDVRSAVPYPKDEVEAMPKGKYHAGSFDWMVAFAILKRFKRIALYGVNLTGGGEPLSARPCLEYWLGVAAGRGIEIEVHGGDTFRIYHLVRSNLQYGYDERFELVEDRVDQWIVR